ncbi:hypothetical protein DMH18_37750 [Streptomyces sp. WAC 06783]|uniref:hypothetical protein n=1 Tax=Streptomyces sp. WAC 06783 TaxID=2203211 RepID=UPI000F73D1AD|nr:hypothetical protein [Streptomyces sp. WAC 06783]RSO03357.1 hypothetical protein DMH18_37750 [Streptomyces sp. WAC 06783]
MESMQELRAVMKAHAELDPLTEPERVRALARLLVFLKVDVVDVYQEAKRLGLLHQQGLIQGRSVNDAEG